MALSGLEARLPRWGPWVNLVLPGAGHILAGSLWWGLLVGLVCAACANFAIVATLIFPDDFTRAAQMGASVLMAGCYLGAQFGVAHGRRRVGAGSVAVRRQVLRETQELVASGGADRALPAIESFAQSCPDDLLVAYRLAEALSVAGDTQRAQSAWRQVRRLDRHGIYRQQVREAELRLRREGARNH